MFRKYGLIGIGLIIFIELNFFLKLQPFANWYFPIIWLGYILTIDALVYKLKGDSLISNRLQQFLGMIIISMLLWWVFEFINLSVGNWKYHGLEGLSVWKTLFGSLSFATVLPAFFETFELVRSIHLFDKAHLKKKHKITKRFLHTLIGLGVLSFLLPLLFPRFAFP